MEIWPLLHSILAALDPLTDKHVQPYEGTARLPATGVLVLWCTLLAALASIVPAISDACGHQLMQSQQEMGCRRACEVMPLVLPTSGRHVLLQRQAATVCCGRQRGAELHGSHMVLHLSSL